MGIFSKKNKAPSQLVTSNVAANQFPGVAVQG